MSRTIGQLWRDAVTAGRTNPAYLVEGEDGWREVSWEEAGTAVDEIANGLLARGIRKGDAFGILAQTSLEWALFDYALARIGAVGAAIYANSSPNDCKHVLENSDSIGVLVEDEEQRAKVAALGLAHVIAFSELDELRSQGREFAAANPTALADAEAEIDDEDLFTFIYTSGTTGPPKGVELTHANLLTATATIGAFNGIELTAEGGGRVICWLPLAHIAERIASYYAAIAFGLEVTTCADPRQVGAALREV
ncbi:MAG TPA: AMP-binding protein, partial [Gaiellaceae bacterium]